MTRSWIIAVVAAAVIFLGGCGRQAAEAPSDPGAQDHATTSEEPSGSRPPQSTLSYGGRTVTGVLGTYCWGSPSGGICADAVGAQVAEEGETLAVPASSVMEFDFGGSVRLSSVGAVAYPIGRGNEVKSHHGLRFLEPKEGRRVLASEDLEVRREGDQAEIPAELPAGEYVVEVSVRTPEGNDAHYSFRVAAEGRKEPVSSTTSDTQVFFPQQRSAPIGYPDAMGGGKLVVDGEGCLRTKVSAEDPGSVPLWPSSFELDTEGDKIQVLDGKGRVVARVGDEVDMGGGDVTREMLEENNVLDERTKQELFERCPGRYFLAQPEMHIG